MQNSLFPIVLSCFAAVLGASANLLFKRAALLVSEVPLYKNWQLFVGLASFSMVLALFMIAFRSGGKLMTVYPAYATTYAWALVFAIFIERESVSTLQVAGIVAIIAGVALIGFGARA